MNTIDFRKTFWGHNLSLIDNDDDGRLKFFTWSTPRPSVGDEVMWSTAHGYCVATVTGSESMRNVSDMAKISVEVTERFWKDGSKVENI